MNPQRQGPTAEAQIESWIQEMSLEEKISLCHADSKFGVPGVERLGIPRVEMFDGPHGVRPEISKDSWDLAGWDDDHATYLPTGTAQASTWNVDMMYKAGQVLGAEARERGKDYILGPGINMVRTPLCGRNFEYYGEDPFQVGKMSASAIRGIQSQDVAACAKHYAVNSQELNRNGTDVELDEQPLRELYLEAFRRAVQEGGVLSVMGAYNKFRGQHCCHHEYLVNDILKKEWGFKGTFISDWAGAHNTEESALCGLDIEMGTNSDYDEYYLARPFREAIISGDIPMEVLDDKVRRSLHVIMSIGMMDKQRLPGARNTSDHQETARRIADEAVVLLKNDDDLLPLNPKKHRKIAVIGKNATAVHSFGGNSSEVKAFYEISPLEGLKELCGDDFEIVHTQGFPERGDDLESLLTAQMKTVVESTGVRGWMRKVLKSREQESTPLAQEAVESVQFTKGDIDLSSLGLVDHCDVVWEGVWTPVESSTVEFAMTCDGYAQVVIDDEVKMELNVGEDSDDRRCTLSVESGKAMKIVILYRHDRYSEHFSFGRAPESDEGESDLERAVACAKAADIVLFFGGLSHQYDVEGRDRQNMNLPLGQNEVLEAILKVNPNVVVTLISGAPCTMPWADNVPAILQGWYAGMEGGRALAGILLGQVNPSGKLPMTFPKCLEDVSAHSVGTYEYDLSRYTEGLFMGYRHFDKRDITPLFPFGHGLSYSDFQYENLRLEPFVGGVNVKCDLSNKGSLSGKEVVQLYVESGAADRPLRELKGFTKVEVKGGSSTEVVIPLEFKDLAIYDEHQSGWSIKTGVLKIHLGSSSRDLRLSETFELKSEDLMT